MKLSKRNFSNVISKKVLTGTWKNEFVSNGVKDSEVCDIKADGRYFINGVHWFNIIDFQFDFEANKIFFIKSAIRSGDDRKFHNTVMIVDINYLANSIDDNSIVNDYSVSYRRLSSNPASQLFVYGVVKFCRYIRNLTKMNPG